MTEGPLLPLRVLVVADLLPRDEHNAGASAPELAVRVDPLAFDDLFGRLRPRLAIEVPSVLAEGRKVRVDLSPTSLKSFRPDGLCERAAAPLAASTASSCSSGCATARSIGINAASSSIGSGARRPSCATSSSSSPSRAARRNAHVRGAREGRSGRVDRRRSSTWSRRIRCAPRPRPRPSCLRRRDKPRRATAASARSSRPSRWAASRAARASARRRPCRGSRRRSARRSASSCSTPRCVASRRRGAACTSSSIARRARRASSIDVVCSRPELAAMALERAIRHNAGGEPPVSCAIVDLTIDGYVGELLAARGSRAGRGGADGAGHRERVACAARARSARGSREARQQDRALLDARSGAWQSTAQRPAMRWVTMAMNGLLARGAYDKATSRVREAVIKEEPGDEGATCGSRPAYAVGALVVQSFRETSWPCRIVGSRNGGTLANLPVREVRGHVDDAEAVAIPTRRSSRRTRSGSSRRRASSCSRPRRTATRSTC